MAFQSPVGPEPDLDPCGPNGPPTTATRIDFSQTPLAEDYGSYFAMVLDNLLTPEECAALQASAGDNWQSLSKGESFRECQQILSFSPRWSAALYERIAAHLPDEVKALRKGSELAANVAGASHLKANMGAKKTVWRLKGANERLSFLRYRPGHFFKPHCDALYGREGKDEKSFLTCQIYLNDAPEGGDGGASGGGETRFWASQVGKRRKARDGNDTQPDDDKNDMPFLDVKPKVGRAVVFQQRMLWHSGQEVKNGEKFTVRMDLMFERHFEKM
ncbi:Uu.00g033700.m01.CDS01 [Anthostomella pinea]|uniref:Uu.00g033700.m01.CDS01 n=1 Tax=Anthostomella pinea TaxID=933095 RepID=A0AAI8V9I8_9PEZI|nr:Uu.00g033700.m01.CDS01 [Anthostomella pinea]